MAIALAMVTAMVMVTAIINNYNMLFFKFLVIKNYTLFNFIIFPYFVN
jgi:hypothetical protein